MKSERNAMGRPRRSAHISERIFVWGFMLAASRDTQLKRLGDAGTIKSPAGLQCLFPLQDAMPSESIYGLGTGVYPVPYPVRLFTVPQHRWHCYHVLSIYD